MTNTKDIARKAAILRRDAIDPSSEDCGRAISLFMEAVIPAPGQVIALYMAKGREFDPLPLLHTLLKKNMTCVLPVVRSDSRILRFAHWREGDTLTPGPYGIAQPAGTEWLDPDIVVVPLLAFDARGNRLGYGGGYYDATLRNLRSRKRIEAVGLAYAQQESGFDLPVEAHDVKLDWIVTPESVRHF